MAAAYRSLAPQPRGERFQDSEFVEKLGSVPEGFVDVGDRKAPQQIRGAEN